MTYIVADIDCNKFWKNFNLKSGYAVAQLLQALRYKPGKVAGSIFDISFQLFH
jgi:hypothetical protein